MAHPEASEEPALPPDGQGGAVPAPDAAMFRVGLDTLNEGVMIFGSDSRIVYANASASRLLDRDDAALRGASFKAWRPVDLSGQPIPDTERTVSRVLVSGLPVRDLIIGDMHDGEVRRWLRINADPIMENDTVKNVVVSFTDITESRRVSNALQANETITRQLLEALADGVFVAQDFTFVFTNPALPAMLGYEPERFAGMPFDRVVHADDYGQWIERYIRRIGSGAEPARDYEIRFLHADGHAVDLELVATRTRYGGRSAVLGVVRDISQRKRTSAELERHRNHLEELVEERTLAARQALESQRQIETFARTVTDNIPVQIAYISAKRKLLFANAAWLQWFGVTRTQAIGRNIADLAPAELVSRWSPAIDRVLQGEIVESSGEMTDARGQVRYFRVSRWPDVKDGVVDGYHLIATDITDLRRSERSLKVANAALADAEQFTRDIADNLPVRIAYWDREMRCRFVNRAYCEFYAVTPDRVLGQRHDDVFHDSKMPDRLRALEDVLAGKPLQFENEEINSGGDNGRFRIHLIPDRRGDEVRGVFVLAIDVTEAQRSQAALQQMNEQLVLERDRAESAATAKAAFLANMSHEIRTPMNAIIGMTHILRRDIEEPKTAEKLGRIADAAAHLLRLVNDILDLSKIEAGKVVIESTLFDVSDMLSRCCSLVAEQARAKKLQLSFDAGTLPARAIGDPTRISQSLVNLLSNAVKFTEQGSIWVGGRIVENDVDGILLRFEVRDSGIGIEADRLASVFSAFEQADTSTTRRFGGTGLGLALTRHLAQLMGGDAGATSEPGVGSVFWITARLRAAAEPMATGAGPLAELRALVADPSVGSMTTLTSLLERIGVRFDAVTRSEEVLERVAGADDTDDPYHVVLIDSRLTGIDSVELAGMLQSDLFESPPACILLDDQTEPMRERAMEVGLTSILEKPVTHSTLHDRLIELMVDRVGMNPPDDSDRAAETLLREHHSGAHILLAEDNAVNQEVATLLLESAGLLVDVANDGREAIAMAAAKRYDLVLMDIQMPHADGLEATRAIRRDPRCASWPIVAMTANAFAEDRAGVIAAGMNDHIVKPVDPTVLYSTLSHWLDLSRGSEGAPAAPVKVAAAALPKKADAASAPAAPAVTVDDACSWLAGIEGFETRRGLAFFAERVRPYLHALGEFAKLYAKGLPGNPAGAEQVRRELHGCGAACASVGAVKLAATSHALLDRIRHTEDPALAARIADEGAASFSAALKELSKTLSERLAAH